jgi:hypothetical protein
MSGTPLVFYFCLTRRKDLFPLPRILVTGTADVGGWTVITHMSSSQKFQPHVHC